MKFLFFFLLTALFGTVGLLIYQMYFTQTNNKVQFEINDHSSRIPKVSLILIPTNDIQTIEAALFELGNKITLVIPQNNLKSKIYNLVARNICDRLLELKLEPDKLSPDQINKNTLLVGIGENNNKKRLLTQLSGPFAYDGVIHIKPSVFIKSESDLLFLLKEIKVKNLIFVEANVAKEIVIKTAKNIHCNAKLCDIFLNEDASKEDVTEALETLESIASLNKPSLGLFYCTKNVVDSIKEWLEKIKESKTVSLTRLSEA